MRASAYLKGVPTPFPYSKRRFYYNRNALFVQSAMESIRFYILIRIPCDLNPEAVRSRCPEAAGIFRRFAQ